MEKQVLINPGIFPTDDVLFPYLKRSKNIFVTLFEYLHSNYPDFCENWKYYNDGKSWLLNVSYKKKTLFWLSVYDGFFRTTFYISSKFENHIFNSQIPQSLKDQYKASSTKKIRGISVLLKSMKDFESFKIILTLKLSCK